MYDMTIKVGNLFIFHWFDLSQAPAGIQTWVPSMRGGRQSNCRIPYPISHFHHVFDRKKIEFSISFILQRKM